MDTDGVLDDAVFMVFGGNIILGECSPNLAENSILALTSPNYWVILVYYRWDNRRSYINHRRTKSYEY